MTKLLLRYYMYEQWITTYVASTAILNPVFKQNIGLIFMIDFTVCKVNPATEVNGFVTQNMTSLKAFLQVYRLPAWVQRRVLML